MSIIPAGDIIRHLGCDLFPSCLLLLCAKHSQDTGKVCTFISQAASIPPRLFLCCLAWRQNKEDRHRSSAAAGSGFCECSDSGLPKHAGEGGVEPGRSSSNPPQISSSKRRQHELKQDTCKGKTIHLSSALSFCRRQFAGRRLRCSLPPKKGQAESTPSTFHTCTQVLPPETTYHHFHCCVLCATPSLPAHTYSLARSGRATS